MRNRPKLVLRLHLIQLTVVRSASCELEFFQEINNGDESFTECDRPAA
jgi:hypothetical protein